MRPKATGITAGPGASQPATTKGEAKTQPTCLSNPSEQPLQANTPPRKNQALAATMAATKRRKYELDWKLDTGPEFATTAKFVSGWMRASPGARTLDRDREGGRKLVLQ